MFMCFIFLHINVPIDKFPFKFLLWMFFLLLFFFYLKTYFTFLWQSDTIQFPTLLNVKGHPTYFI